MAGLGLIETPSRAADGHPYGYPYCYPYADCCCRRHSDAFGAPGTDSRSDALPGGDGHTQSLADAFTHIRGDSYPDTQPVTYANAYAHAYAYSHPDAHTRPWARRYTGLGDLPG
jgi:hypothetical protein